jgi:hypothetical protein
MKKVFGLLLGLLMFTPAFSGESPILDGALPALAPVSATSFLCAMKGDDKIHIIAMIFTFPDGTVIRFDKDHQRGIDGNALMDLADSAPDSAIYTVQCMSKPTST